ncbi:hypothetical protein LR48_Vigan11g036100 [Vigna angularis]|uniref:Uncharacterized protein n=1 Tax=Phaseolus angularis TaxID=3914 RepID=A0A0L9VQU7_PHAAN|nr:transcription factor SRM1 [Vigna angularis]KOM57328.1 hypothetical protein LR48_Vigan11g036100 [Vigna angularis]
MSKDMNNQFESNEFPPSSSSSSSSSSSIASTPTQTNSYKKWSEEEHKLFLKGLEIYKKGQWTNISRYVVKTRTPAQVSSHAQHYYKHLAALNKGKRKSFYDAKTSYNKDAFLSHDQVHMQNDDVNVSDYQVDVQNDQVHMKNDAVYVPDYPVDVQNDDVYVPDYQVDQAIFADLDFLEELTDVV